MQEITRKNARIWSMLGMRRTVGILLKEFAKEDRAFVFATADMARYMGAEDFSETFPDQFVDVGIAEQNLIGVAAGMQKEGFHVFAGTYATFLTARALDQIRVSLGYMKLGVKLIGISGGLSDGNFSPTHMALEDIADMRAIPNLTVISPADGAELVKAMYALRAHPGPAYLRLTGRANTPVVYTQEYDFAIGRAVCLREGRDVALIAAGTMAAAALNVAEELCKSGISCKVMNMHTIKPLDEAALDAIEEFGLAVTMEEHMRAGGLGSAVAEYMAQKEKRPVQLMLAVEDVYPQSAEYEQLLESCGLTVSQMTERILKKCRELGLLPETTTNCRIKGERK